MWSHTGSRFCFLLSYIALTTGANIYDGVADGGQNGNPGAKLRVTQKGLDYLNSILLYEMTQIIPRLRVDDFDHSENNGRIRMSNARVTSFKPPTTQTLRLSPPDQIVWASSGINIAMSGHVWGTYGRFHDEGDADVIANDVSFEIAIQPIRQANGQFGARARGCNANVGDLDYNLYNTGALGRFLQNYKGAVLKRLKPRIGERLCNQVVKLIDHAANEQLATIPTKVPLNRSADQMFGGKTGNSGGLSKPAARSQLNTKGPANLFDTPDLNPHSHTRDKSREAQRELTRNITKHLMLDYSNTRDPIVQPLFLETYNRGEISYHGLGGTPFQPSMMHENSVQSDRMIYLLASDYVANSLLYNAYVHDLLKTRISAEETPDFKAYLKTTCDDDSIFDFCLGSVIPEMQETFPDSQAEINFEATKAPALLFRNDGTVNLLGQGLIKLVAAKAGQRRTMAVANLDMTAKGKLFIDRDRVKGNCSFDKYDMTIKENNLKGFNDQRQKEFTSSSKQLMEVLINAYLKNGIRLPSMKAAKLRNSKLNIFGRTARIDSDVEADKDQLTKMAVEIIQKHGGRVEGY